MSKLPTPARIDAAPAASQPLLQAVEKQIGRVPNFFSILSNSPAALEGFLGLNAAVSKNSLDAKTRERIALAVSAVNGCDYCDAAHSYFATNLAKLDAAELRANRQGQSTDAKADAAVRFATAIATQRGKLDHGAVAAVLAAGYDAAAVVDIISVVASLTFSNLINNVLETDIDFPAAA